MSGEITPRDRVWAAIYQQHGQFKVKNVKFKIDREQRPSDETIRRVLRAGKELGVIKHTNGSPYYELQDGR